MHLGCGELRSGPTSKGDHGGRRWRDVALLRLAFALCISLTFDLSCQWANISHFPAGGGKISQLRIRGICTIFPILEQLIMIALSPPLSATIPVRVACSDRSGVPVNRPIEL